MFQLTIKEEFFGSGHLNELPVRLSSERITLSQLIQQKVEAKVKQINKKADIKGKTGSFLSTHEQVLNNHALKKRVERQDSSQVDAEQAVYHALAGFQRNAFFVIIDGKQREKLEEELILTKQSEVQFVQLMPLVGG